MSLHKCGVYQIQCVVSGKRYIGSSKRIAKRWYEHRRALRAGVHTSPRLQRAWHKHGEQNFVFSVLEECLALDLLVREQFHIDVVRPDYNSMPRVRVVTAEMRAKMNAAMAVIAAARTHCPHGHEYTEANSYLSKKDGKRICRACNRARVAAIYAAETPEQTAERLRKGMERYYANHAERRAKANEYSARTRDQKRAYDVAYRPIKNERRRMLQNATRVAEA